MNNKNFIHVSLRLNYDDHALLKSNASHKKQSLNNYMIDLIRADTLKKEDLLEIADLVKLMKKNNDMSMDLLVYNYVIFKLGAAILSFFYTSDPSDEGMENAIRFVNRKLEEAKKQFK